MNSAGEQLLSDVVAVLSQSFPNLEVERTKSILSIAIAKYHIQKVEEDEPHPDSDEKLKMFLSSKRLEGLSPLTLDGYQMELRIFFRKVIKRTDAVTAADIRAYLGQYNHLKMSTVGRKLSVLKSFFGWLAAEELIQRDPSARLKTPKQEKRLPKALTVAELEMLRESCKTVRQRAFIEVMYATGCRLSEVYGMDRSGINHQSMSCRVIGKGNKEREVYFSFKAMYHLDRYLSSRSDDCEALMVTERRPFRRLSRRGIQREIDVIAKAAGLAGKVSPHVLRHTFATLTLNNGAELVAVQELMGHSDPQTTLRYARITEERKREQHKRFLVQ
ncbi:tyrosine-type recombinase/integrase [Paenibacillus senegalimassiliensis]|uniref:tyrosine-type recombinase/integrase n=1 Tax=Paenibacillus senegalimassiliensis TaxID=1737426 RepID=UPI00073EF8B7|nr:tyrosine-type recombinase/integrase [Paenibacillus senegalimassiliensis]